MCTVEDVAVEEDHRGAQGTAASAALEVDKQQRVEEAKLELVLCSVLTDSPHLLYSRMRQLTAKV
jgi:hypothetical protein